MRWRSVLQVGYNKVTPYNNRRTKHTFRQCSTQALMQNETVWTRSWERIVEFAAFDAGRGMGES